MYQAFCEFLEKAMQKELPGKEAHLKMLPKEMSPRLLIQPDQTARLSSVLVAIYPENDIPHIIFIKRQEYEGVHSGQISFPGGKKEAGDKSMWHTALREANEEINLEISLVQKLGKLSDVYIERSNHIVHPYIGKITEIGDLKADAYEVKDIIKVSIPYLLHKAKIRHFILTRKNVDYAMPYYDLYGEVLWGATAMMVSEFLEVSSPFFE